MLRYRLDDLGWFQFECMVQSLLKHNFGLGIESWAGRGDHGIDAFFKNALEFPRRGELREGPFIFQVKFIEEANAAGAKPRSRIISSVQSEIKRVKRRKYFTNESVYIIITNTSLPPRLRTEINTLLQNTFPNFEIFTIGGQDICDMLDNFPYIRQSFPQILSLRDLDTLLTSVVARPIIERSRGMIEEARELSSIFYPTESYNNCFLKLTKHNFAVLEGPPEVGKTAIARMVGLSQLSMGWEAIECLSPNEFFQLISSDKHQIFIADDAFGSTEYDPSRTNEWARNLDKIIRRLDKKHWLIWTARKHILEMALEKMRLQGKGEDFPEPGAVLIDAGKLTKIEKAMILYRHAKAAGLENDAREFVKEYAELIVSDQHFTPERIRRFVCNSLSGLIDKYNSGNFDKKHLSNMVKKEIQEPTKSLKQAFECLPVEHRWLLISRLDTSWHSHFISEEEKRESFERHRSPTSSKSYEKIEQDLLLSFLKQSPWSEGWIHPSIRDLVIDYLIASKPERYNFLSNCSISGISLAMSVGGGGEGSRNFPLIIDSDDMHIVISKVEELIKKLPPDELLGLMTIIHESKVRCSEVNNQKITEFITEVFEKSLESIVKRWEGDKSINNQMLNLYYQMAKLSKSYQSSPPLEVIWFELTSKIEHALNKMIKQDYIDKLREVEDLLEFIDIIEDEEPRFLKYIDFPNCFSKQANNFLQICIKEAEAQYEIEANEEDLSEIYMEESQKFKSLQDIWEQVFLMDIKFNGDLEPDEILELIETASSYYEQKAVEYFYPEPDYEEGGSHREEIDIADLFSDL